MTEKDPIRFIEDAIGQIQADKSFRLAVREFSNDFLWFNFDFSSLKTIKMNKWGGDSEKEISSFATNITPRGCFLTNFPPAFRAFFRETHKKASVFHSHVTNNTKLHQHSRYFSICCGWEGGDPFLSVEPPSCLTGDEFCTFSPRFCLRIRLMVVSGGGGRSTFGKSLAAARGGEGIDGIFRFQNGAAERAGCKCRPFYGLDRSLPLQRCFPDNFVASSVWCTQSIQR